jgi:hypothetical protein
MTSLIITLSTGTKVEVKDPACLLGLTPEEYAELRQILNNKEKAA